MSLKLQLKMSGLFFWDTVYTYNVIFLFIVNVCLLFDVVYLILISFLANVIHFTLPRSVCQPALKSWLTDWLNVDGVRRPSTMFEHLAMLDFWDHPSSACESVSKNATLQFLLHLSEQPEKPRTQGHTDHFRNNVLMWPWTLTYDVDLLTWARLGQDNPSCRIYRLEVISLASYHE